MILSTWNLEYALHLQITKTVCFRYMRRPVRLLMHFAIPKSILISQGRLNWLIFFLNLYTFC